MIRKPVLFFGSPQIIYHRDEGEKCWKYQKTRKDILQIIGVIEIKTVINKCPECHNIIEDTEWCGFCGWTKKN